jgi:hypothetical protein
MAEITLNKLSGSSYKKIDPLPPQNPAQKGPNCGLYALSYVMRHWHLKLQGTTPIPEPPPARKLDVEGATKLPAGDLNKKVSLRQYAKGTNLGTHPLTFLGELFSADALARVATEAQFQAKVHKPALQNYVKTVMKLIDANHPAIVSLDVTADSHAGGIIGGSGYGCPGKFGGEHAHWAVIAGYEVGWFWDDFVMFHWEKYFQFAANDLRDSANQLMKFSAQTWYKPTLPAERVFREETGDVSTYQVVNKKYQKVDPKQPLNLPIVAIPTSRGGHWQKLKPGTSLDALTPAWDTGNRGAYAGTNNVTPTMLSTKCNGVVVQTVFKNTNLDLRNVIIEVVPQGTAFATIT